VTADLNDRTDFDNADRGFIGKLTPGVVTTADGRVVWDIDEFADLLHGDAPATVNPSLWRQSKLTAKQGL
jgi:alkyl sulfatase BDS1-like metallo-beta-lactamase superfamily hydrolase